MITILHGENTTLSRNRLQELIATARAAGQTVTHIDGSHLKPAAAELLVGESSLFAGGKLMVIEELHSQPLGKKRDALVAQIAQVSDDLILWEKKKLTALMIKRLGSGTKAEVFEPSKTVWKLVGALSAVPTTKPQLLELYQQTITTEDPFFLLTLFIRQIRLLIQLQTGPAPQLAPFQLGGLRSQLKNFSLPQLLAAHHRLLLIDYEQKSGQAALSLEQELFLFLYNL